jgi:hypothetical protein
LTSGSQRLLLSKLHLHFEQQRAPALIRNSFGSNGAHLRTCASALILNIGSARFSSNSTSAAAFAVSSEIFNSRSMNICYSATAAAYRQHQLQRQQLIIVSDTDSAASALQQQHNNGGIGDNSSSKRFSISATATASHHRQRYQRQRQQKQQ